MELDKYENLKNIVYNDSNPLNVNLFKCIKNYEEFHNYIKDIPSQERERFNEYQKHCFEFKDFTENPNYQIGLEYIYVVTQVFSGKSPQTSSFIDLKRKYKSKFDTFKGKLNNPKWQGKFAMINFIEDLDFENSINKWDSDKTYIYCDPPYWKTEKYYSNHDFGVNDHERLSNVLKNIKGKFSLSYYYFNQLESWFPKEKYHWESKLFKKSSAAMSGKNQNDGEELLIMNY
jgi:DNA adenine methylase